MSEAEILNLRSPEAIRKRPSMYVGSTTLFGLIHYLVCPFSLLLALRPKHISVTVDDGFVIRSDAQLEITEIQGRTEPFESYQLTEKGYRYEGCVLNALSQELRVTVKTPSSTEDLHFSKGIRISREITAADLNDFGTTLRFKPDAEIFTVKDASPAIFESYLRRMSYLHAGTRFRLTVGDTVQEFYSPNGIEDLFTAISSPYQLMHEPIKIVGQAGSLGLQLVMAYHSWHDHHLWCFMNNGRAVLGGTHEQGLLKALKELRKRLAIPDYAANGVVAVMSLHYPDAVWEGCIKAKIGNKELKSMVSKLVITETENWLKQRPEVAAQIRQIQTFPFPEVWDR